MSDASSCASPTPRDHGARPESVSSDEIIQLRQWGSDLVHLLPARPKVECTIGSSSSCSVTVRDPYGFISRRHAKLVRFGAAWRLFDDGSKNGVWLDGARVGVADLYAGAHLGLGSVVLVAESARTLALRRYVERLLGWSPERRLEVDRAMRLVHDMVRCRRPLLLRGDEDLVAIARQLHDRFAEAQPFLAPRASRRARRPGEATQILREVRGATWCVWSRALPEDFAAAVTDAERTVARVRIIVCGGPSSHVDQALAPSVMIPPLAQRLDELDRVIDEYAADAIASLGARPSSWRPVDRAWIRRSHPLSHAELATATLRTVAIREYGGVTRAAERLGLSHVALVRWRGRRR